MGLLRKLFFVACSVSASFSFPQSGTSTKSCAEAIVVIGKVSRDPGAKAIVSGERIGEGTRLKTEANAYVKLLLNDQSVIDISPKTSFVLRQCVAPRVNGIDLDLELGRVRANVNPEPSEPRRHFRLKTPTSVLAVRGTEFFVNWAQDRTGLVNERVAVSEGQVEIRSLFQQNASPTLLQTGMEFRAEGALRDQNRPLPRVDQFNAEEQRKLEREQKIEAKREVQPVERASAPLRASVAPLAPQQVKDLVSALSIPLGTFENAISLSKQGASKEQMGNRVQEGLQKIANLVVGVMAGIAQRGIASFDERAGNRAGGVVGGNSGQSINSGNGSSAGSGAGTGAGAGSSSPGGSSGVSAGVGTTNPVTNNQIIFVKRGVFMKVEE